MPQPPSLGVDVARDHLDVAVYPTQDAWRVPNTPAGHARLVRWVQAHVPTRLVLEASGGYERAVDAALTGRGAAGGGGQSAAGARLRPQPQHPGQDRPPRRLGAGPLRRRGPAAAASAPRCGHPPPARPGHPPPPAPRHARGGAAAAPPSPAGPPRRLRRPSGLADAAPGRPRRAARPRGAGPSGPARARRLAAEHSRHWPRRLPHLARRAARTGHALPPPDRRPRRRGPLQSRQRRLVAAGKPKLVALTACMRKLLVLCNAL